MRQLEHHEVKTAQHNKQIVVLVEDVISPENVGMIFRISEAMGVATIYLIGNTPKLPNKKITKTARTTEKKVFSQHCSSASSLIPKLVNEGYEIFALEVTDKSKKINSVNFTVIEKVAIVIGSESNGIKAETLGQIKTGIMIPMYGDNTSINVVAALTIALYEVIRN